jgi:hypothetical protein
MPLCVSSSSAPHDCLRGTLSQPHLGSEKTEALRFSNLLLSRELAFELAQESNS